MRFSLAITFLFFINSTYLYAEPMLARPVGKVVIPDSAKLDAKTKRELAALASQIIKSRQKGVVMLTGDVPSAESAEEYSNKSVFLARTVEVHLKPLLSKRYQLYVTASKYSGVKRAGRNTVAIALYPRELVAGYGASITEPVIPAATLAKENIPVQEQAASPVYRQPAQSGLLTPPQYTDDTGKATSKKERVSKEPEENAELAKELVRKAKARAAEKAKRLQQVN